MSGNVNGCFLVFANLLFELTHNGTQSRCIFVITMLQCYPYCNILINKLVLISILSVSYYIFFYNSIVRIFRHGKLLVPYMLFDTFTNNKKLQTFNLFHLEFLSIKNFLKEKQNLDV